MSVGDHSNIDPVLRQSVEESKKDEGDKIARDILDQVNEITPLEQHQYTLEVEKNTTRRYVHRVQSFDKNQKSLFTPNFIKEAVVMALWFFTSFASIVLNKYILSTLDVDASLLGACQIVMTTFFGTIVMCVPYICNFNSRKRQKKSENINRYKFYKTISILGWLRFLCSIFADIKLLNDKE